ncbi:MAG: nicotinate-nucleotide--dimethylbenzimidazole phosphoribosyltransferase [Desulfobacteraceae bacterium]|nr:nicotinate-nucleotide--dimethylbenzimidazole phosphoribosyltransferase [Desulfobacteraceae bacterium]
MKLQEAVEKIILPDNTYEKKAARRLDEQARPQGSLGMLEETARRLAGIAGTLDVCLNRKVIVTCAGDHGVTAEGVSLFPQEVTAQMVYNFIDGGASINVLGRHAGALVQAADLGVNHEFEPQLPVFHKKIAKGTGNIRREPAMSRDQAVSAIEAGISIVQELAEDPGVNLLGTGDMGIGNTTPSTAVIAAFSGINVEKLTGRGTGLDDKALAHKIRVITDSLAFHKPDPKDPVGVLAKVGGFEIGGLAGLVIGAAAMGIPVICDGLIATAGALIACEIAPLAKSYLFTSHRSVEAGHRFMIEHLGIQPLLDLGLRLGEGTGAALAMEIMDASTRVLAEIKTFEEVAIKNAQKK